MPVPTRTAAPEAVGPAPPDSLPADPFEALALVGRLFSAYWPDFGDFCLVAKSRRGGPDMCVPCPRQRERATPAPLPEGGNFELVLSTLAEADAPVRLRELARRALGGEPTGAFREAVHRLADAGRIERIGDPPHYALAGRPVTTPAPEPAPRPVIPMTPKLAPVPVSVPNPFVPPRSTGHDDD